MALQPTCNDVSGGFFCDQLANCVIQNLGNVDFTNDNGCSQFLVLGENGIVTPVADPNYYLNTLYVGAPIIHPATPTVGVVVNVPLNTILQNDLCPFIPNGVSIPLVELGSYYGSGILVTGNHTTPPQVTNIQVSIDGAPSGNQYARVIRTVKPWTLGGGTPFQYTYYQFNNLQFVPPNESVTINVLAEGGSFEIITATLNVWRTDKCPCAIP